MKGIKKLIISLLALVMVMGASVTAFAAGTGSITVKDAKKGQVYNAYRVFDFIPADEENPAKGGTYKLSEKWSNAGFTDNFFTVDDQGFVVVSEENNTDTAAAAFGKNVIAFAKAKGIAADATDTASGDGNLLLGNLVYGYYVVDSSLGAAVSVDTNTPAQVISEKNDVPDLDKKVEEDSDPGNIDKTVFRDETNGNDAEIGQIINYETVVNLKKGGTNYKVVDTMTEGLTLDQSSLTYTYSVEGATTAGTPNYVNNGFEVTFSDPTADVTVTINYSAKLNNKAVVSAAVNNSAAGENINTAYLVYGNNTETTHKTTETKTYQLSILKYAAEDNTKEPLAGAEFTLINKSNVEAGPLHFTVSSDGFTYTVTEDTTATTSIVTKADGQIVVKGLDNDSYYLTETVAPEGRNLISDKVDDYEHTKLVNVSDTVLVEVPNSAGTLLPSTGGIGTTIFYIVGGLLIVAGVAYFIVRRKADAE